MLSSEDSAEQNAYKVLPAALLNGRRTINSVPSPGELVTVMSACISCRILAVSARPRPLPSVAWDGEVPLNLHGTDTYFFDEDSLLDHCADVGCQPRDLPLVICVPRFAKPIDGSEHYSDDLPEDRTSARD